MRINQDELELLRRHASAVPFVPIDPHYPVKSHLPDPLEAPFAHPVYTLRLALGSAERFTAVTKIQEPLYRRWVAGVSFPTVPDMLRLGRGCMALGKLDHAVVFHELLGTLLGATNKTGEIRRAVWELVRGWAHDTPPEELSREQLAHEINVWVSQAVLAINAAATVRDWPAGKVEALVAELPLDVGTVTGEFADMLRIRSTKDVIIYGQPTVRLVDSLIRGADGSMDKRRGRKMGSSNIGRGAQEAGYVDDTE